ncbi:MAG: DUF1566 domain-containing protein [Nitrospinae bacterium]|nr:DUF1566 domain-containing protein [Nitrospinota bacterium]
MKKWMAFILSAIFLTGVSAHAGNFTDNGNDTVTDNNTGLAWQKTEGGAMAWESAISYCKTLSLAGQSGWRLPNKRELMSIVNYGKNNPAIDTASFPNANSSLYWSSTTTAGGASSAWYVDFYLGGVSYNDKSHDSYVRCVRGGQ